MRRRLRLWGPRERPPFPESHLLPLASSIKTAADVHEISSYERAY
jgi:hypothetical protein